MLHETASCNGQLRFLILVTRTVQSGFPVVGVEGRGNLPAGTRRGDQSAVRAELVRVAEAPAEIGLAWLWQRIVPT